MGFIWGSVFCHFYFKVCQSYYKIVVIKIDDQPNRSLFCKPVEIQDTQIKECSEFLALNVAI